MNHAEAKRMHDIKTRAGRLGFSIQPSNQLVGFYRVYEASGYGPDVYLFLVSLEHLEAFMNERWKNRSRG